jgi:hypothetical protein
MSLQRKKDGAVSVAYLARRRASLEPFHQDTIMQWTKPHGFLLPTKSVFRCCCGRRNPAAGRTRLVAAFFKGRLNGP